MRKVFKKTEGFTLVELIVVIAILGILAGVGTVGYSGYIKKANMAADQQLVAAINQAYAIACVENGVNAAETTASNITIGDDKTIAAADIQVTDPAEKADAIEAAFAKYFAGNESAAFKVAETLNFKRDKGGVFEADFVDGETVTLDYNGTPIVIANADIQKLSGSTFGTVLGAGGMLGKVDYVTQLAGELMSGADSNSTFVQLIAGPEYGAILAENLGIDIGNEEGQGEFVTTVGGMVDDKMDLLIAQGKFAADADRSEGSALYTSAYNQIVANNAVMNAAKNSNAVYGDILTVLGGTNSRGSIVQTINSNSGEGLAQASMAYGLYTAYAAKNNITVSDNPADVLLALDSDEDFKDYINNVDGSGQAQKDLDGYLAAMNMINTNVSSNKTAVSDILVNGFANESLVDLLEQAMGQ